MKKATRYVFRLNYANFFSLESECDRVLRAGIVECEMQPRGEEEVIQSPYSHSMVPGGLDVMS